MTWRLVLLVAAAVVLLAAASSDASANFVAGRSSEELALIRRREEGMGLKHFRTRRLFSNGDDNMQRRYLKNKLQGRSSTSISCNTTTSPGFNVEKVATVAVKLASHSWEYGVTFDALLELCSPSRSVFSSSAFPSGDVPDISVSTHTALTYIKPLITTRSSSLVNGAGSLTDPVSLTIGAVLVGQTTKSYLTAAKSQIATLLAGKKFFNGAISSRVDVAEVWADAMYMFTPALAYYGPTVQRTKYLSQAVDQATYYRQVLKANTTESWKGLWVHIVGPQSATYGVWLTGNGWAAMAMVRILATMENWSSSTSWTVRSARIKKYIYEILDGCVAVGTSPDGSGLLANYLVGDSSSQDADAAGNFGDASGTSMIASVVYRMMVLDPTNAKPYLSWANKLRRAVAQKVNSRGYLTQTVDPYNWYDDSSYSEGSAEGQAAAVLMAAAYSDCVKAGRC